MRWVSEGVGDIDFLCSPADDLDSMTRVQAVADLYCRTRSAARMSLDPLQVTGLDHGEFQNLPHALICQFFQSV